MQRLIGDLGVRGHGVAGFFARENFFRARGSLVHRDVIKLQPHDIQFHVQAYLTNLESIIILAHISAFVHAISGPISPRAVSHTGGFA